jgi:hypothetical protein
MTLRHLQRLASGFQVSMPTDENGLTGRQCPNPGCSGYFKIKFGTGLRGEDLPCHCPYCGHTAGQDQFWTQEQIEYAKSVALKRIDEAMRADVNAWDRELRRKSRGSFLKLSVEYKGRPHPIRYYEEKQLETTVVCEVCTLEYAIYGVFAYCPDCGTHNSLQILNANLDLARKQIVLATEQEDPDFAAYLVADALENAVSAFDGFGRAACGVYASVATDPQKAQTFSFQNLPGANRRLQDLFGFDLSHVLSTDQWASTCRCFQKRHLFAHRMGVVDQAYVDATADTEAVVGRKIAVSADEVISLMSHLGQLGLYLVTQLSSLSGVGTATP